MFTIQCIIPSEARLYSVSITGTVIILSVSLIVTVVVPTILEKSVDHCGDIILELAYIKL